MGSRQLFSYVSGRRSKLSSLLNLSNSRGTSSLIRARGPCSSDQERVTTSLIRAPGSCFSYQQRFMSTTPSSAHSTERAEVVKKAFHDFKTEEIVEQCIKKAVQEGILGGHIEERVKNAVGEAFKSTNVSKLVEDGVNQAFASSKYEEPMKQVLQESFNKHNPPYGSVLYWASIYLALGLSGLSNYLSAKDHKKVMLVVNDHSAEMRAETEVLLHNMEAHTAQLLKDILKEERAMSWFGWI